MRQKIGILLLLFSFLLFVMFVPTGEAASKQLIIINKKTNQLAYYENHTLVKVFWVGTGKTANLTPEGKFKIVNKIKNRPYYKENIPGGSPKNPLGVRWLGINARGTWGTTYAIHGNNNAASIGYHVSNGCIRMYNDQVSWLFDRVAINTPVIITTTNNDFNKIAHLNGYKVSGTVSVSMPAISLMKGSKGAHVKTMQARLLNVGFDPKGVDGIFGNATEQAVKKFQSSKNLKQDGIVGASTLRALGL